MATLPQLQLDTVSYYSGWSLVLQWTPQSFPQNPWWVSMQLYADQGLTQPVGNAVITSLPYIANGTWSTALSGATLNAGTIYWIAVAAVNAQTAPTQTGPWSNTLPILYLAAPAISAASFDGAKLSVGWTQASGSQISQYQLNVLANGAPFATLNTSNLGFGSDSGPSSWVFDLSAMPLAGAPAPLTFQLVPTYVDPVTQAASYGPPATANLFPTRPAILQTTPVSVQSGLQYTVLALNQGYGTTTPPQFQASVFNRGTLIYGPNLLTSSFDSHNNAQMTLALPVSFFPGSSSIPPGLELTVSLQQGDGTSVGPAGAASSLLQDAPSITSAIYGSGSLAVQLAYAPGAPANASALVSVWQGATLTASGTIAGTSGTIPVTLTSGTNYTATVARLAGGSSGPSSAAVSLMSTAPTLTMITFDGSVVRVTWQPVAASTYPGLTGLLLSVLSGTQTVASTVVSADTAALSVPSTSAPLVVQLQMVGAAAVGPPVSSALLQSAPSISSSTTNAANSQTTLSWSSLSNVSYLLRLYSGGLPWGAAIACSTNSYVTTTPLPAGAPLTAAVSAVLTAGSLTTWGPLGATAPIPTAQPNGVRVEYDGTTALVVWQSVAGATGYTLTLLGNGVAAGTFSAAAGATSLVIAPVISDATQSYTVVVQALFGASSGLPSAPAALFQGGFFVSSQALTTAAPYVYPASSLQYVAAAGSAAPGMPLTLYLPDLGGGTPLTVPVTQGAFSLNTSSSSPSYPYALTIAANSEAWQFSGQAIRQTLQNDYITFLKNCETAHATPFGISVLQQAIARSLPQTFQETLYYSYGLDLVNGRADLRPGMVLRVAFADYVTIAGSTQQWINGYMGGSTADYDIGSYLGAQNSWLVGADAFLAQLVASGMLQVTPPPQSIPSQSQAGVADAADLFYPLFNQPFYRLFFPSQLATPWSQGSTLTSAGFTIAAAVSYTQLTQTVNVPSANPIAYFRGRAVLKLCIRVRLDGNEVVVPIGTTVRNLLERQGQAPPDTSVAVSGIRLERALGSVVLDQNAALALGQRYRVRFDWKTMTLYAPGYDPLSLPLLHGDSLTLD